MSEYRFDDKPKNSDYYAPPERGGCLTAFLVVLAIGNLLVIFMMFGLLGSLDSLPSSDASFVQILSFVQIGMSIGVFVCIYGLWNWKQWGYYGLIVLYAINAIVSLMSGNPSTIAGAVIGFGLLFYVMRDKTQYLES